ncbi:hypothetical protein [uncultured Alsobacter sp.]|uniref:hypothetical protein n=1 Tax=uncultured Alsobacter sp. TaxID=1748258 RepID=UPI0025FBD61E|nr:hypothetical protein [uncultured Alsobacter sp.]
MTPRKSSAKRGPGVERSTRGSSRTARMPMAAAHASLLEEARVAGLLDGEKSEHVSFRAPPALIEAAKRETGLSSMSELGTLALAMLAQPDPAGRFLKRTRGRLGKAHTLET